MSKIKLLTHRDMRPSLWNNWLRPLASEYFELIWLEDNSVAHTPADSVVMLRPTFQNFRNLFDEYRSRGYRIVVDNLWDGASDSNSSVQDGVLTLESNSWFWYNESMCFKYYGFDQYCPAPTRTKTFLMLMNRKKALRTKLYNKLMPLLDHSICSYVGAGRHLDNDLAMDAVDWQRYFNPSWYNDTSFSVVVESNIQPRCTITEKTYKPLAYFHPMIICGPAGVLAHLKRQGFETFDHVFDEDYDQTKWPLDRFIKICDIITELHYQIQRGEPVFQDQITQQKLHHNHNRFFDQKLVERGMVDKIFSQIIQFAES
jgi:hypothetical protein